AGCLLGELGGRELAQLVVDQGQQSPSGGRIALLDGGQDARDLAHRRHRNGENLGWTTCSQPWSRLRRAGPPAREPCQRPVYQPPGPTPSISSVPRWSAGHRSRATCWQQVVAVAVGCGIKLSLWPSCWTPWLLGATPSSCR